MTDYAKLAEEFERRVNTLPSDSFVAVNAPAILAALWSHGALVTALEIARGYVNAAAKDKADRRVLTQIDAALMSKTAQEKSR